MVRAWVYCTLCYLVAGVAAAFSVLALPFDSPIVAALVADAVGTVVVFGFSRVFDNSSFYDPYWSVAPIAIALFWAFSAGAVDGNALRQGGVILLVTLWGARLTYNWCRRWEGLEHEDWRYVDLRQKHGSRYWLVSFAGIHFFPTLLVFLGCLPLYPALTEPEPLGGLDAIGALVTLGAIAIESVADRQLHVFLARPPAPGELLATGVWRYSRYPNYLGEILFWWGLFFFGVAAAPRYAWTIVGAIAITVLFRFISIPMMEARKRNRRPGYADHAARTSLLIPWPPKAAGRS